MSKIKINIVKKDSLVPIQIHESYYTLVKNTLFVLIDRQTDPKQALINACSDDEMTIDESIIKIFMALIKETEINAKENNLLEETEVEIPEQSN